MEMKTVKMSDTQYADYLEYLTQPTNILDIPKPTKGEFGDYNTHPTIKPLKFMTWLVKLLSNEGDTVLDPFNGSGTTGVACVSLGRKYIGCEMNPEYIDISKQRTNNSELCTFLLGDCLETLKSIPDNSVQTVITDPPYAIAIAKWDTFMNNKAFQEFTTKWATECYRILKPGGSIACFSASRLYHYAAIGIDEAGFICRDMVEWVYFSGMPKGKNLKGCHEPVYIGWKDKDTITGKKCAVTKDLVYNLDAVRIPVKEKAVKGDKDSKIVQIHKFEMPVKTVNDMLEYEEPTEI